MSIDAKLRSDARARISAYGDECAHWYGYNHKMDSISFALALLAGLVPIAIAPLVNDLTALKWITASAGLISAATVAVRAQFYWDAKTKFYGRARAECNKLLDQLLLIDTKQQLDALVVLLTKLRDDESALSAGTTAQDGIKKAMEALKIALNTGQNGDSTSAEPNGPKSGPGSSK
jgi:hypothetical protein